MKLFKEPFDLDDIERVIADDDFMSLAHLMTGRDENWRVALDQIDLLLTMFEESERNSAPLYQIISVLVQRTAQLRNPSERLDEITTRLGLLKGATYWKQPDQLPEMLVPAMSPEQKDKKWLEEYRAKRR